MYQPGRLGLKMVRLLKQTASRVAAVARAGRYDAIWIYREAMPVGPPVLESLLMMFDRPLLYDFDDAVFLANTSDANRWIAALKCPWKTDWIIRHAAQVVAGNEYLASHARPLNRAVTVIPTAVDTTMFVPRAGAGAAAAPVVGWIGTPTTAPYLTPLGAPLAALAREHAFTFRVSGGGHDLSFDGVRTEYPEWSLEQEVTLFNTCDVGVYPMPDDDWARGKSGFKAIQFMACGVPVVASPVGVNREIIRDGENGFLASTPDEWERTLRALVTDAALRRRIGAAGRATVEARYSLHVNAPRVAAVLRQTAARVTSAAPLEASHEEMR